MELDQKRATKRSVRAATRGVQRSGRPERYHTRVSSAVVGGFLAVAACATTKSAEQQVTVEPYSPVFAYPIPEARAHLKKTIGVIAPTNNSSVKTIDDPTYKAMMVAVRTGTAQLIQSKGYRIIGNYVTRDEFTFPEKKAARLIIYQRMDVQSTFNTQRVEATDISGGNLALAFVLPSLAANNVRKTGKCVTTVGQFGSVGIMVAESITGEIMATKRVDIPGTVQTFESKDWWCQAPSQEASNAWARMNEATYKSVMAAIDKLITPEEVEQWDASAQEIRQNTKFNSGGTR